MAATCAEPNTSALSDANATKSVLMTQDPYHVPGYDGYVPKYKFHISDTFAHATHKILTDKHSPGSQWSVLSETQYKPPMQYEKLDALRGNLVRSRTQSWGDQKLQDAMVPGYTGFIPKRQNYFGKRYTEEAFRSTADFEYHTQVNKQNKEELSLSVALQSGKMAPKSMGQQPRISGYTELPLRPQAKDAAPYLVPHVYPESAYAMSSDSPKKFFVSGYKGYVPRERYLHGRGHTVTTNMSLNQFNDEQVDHRRGSGNPVEVRKPNPMKPYDGVIVYPECSGIIPKYYGYVPGEKFRFGARFAESTENVLKVGEPETMQPRRTRDCPPLPGSIIAGNDPRNCFSCSGSKELQKN